MEDLIAEIVALSKEKKSYEEIATKIGIPFRDVKKILEKGIDQTLGRNLTNSILRRKRDIYGLKNSGLSEEEIAGKLRITVQLVKEDLESFKRNRKPKTEQEQEKEEEKDLFCEEPETRHNRRREIVTLLNDEGLSEEEIYALYPDIPRKIIGGDVRYIIRNGIERPEEVEPISHVSSKHEHVMKPEAETSSVVVDETKSKPSEKIGKMPEEKGTRDNSIKKTPKKRGRKGFIDKLKESGKWEEFEAKAIQLAGDHSNSNEFIAGQLGVKEQVWQRIQRKLRDEGKIPDERRARKIGAKHRKRKNFIDKLIESGEWEEFKNRAVELLNNPSYTNEQVASNLGISKKKLDGLIKKFKAEGCISQDRRTLKRKPKPNTSYRSEGTKESNVHAPGSNEALQTKNRLRELLKKGQTSTAIAVLKAMSSEIEVSTGEGTSRKPSDEAVKTIADSIKIIEEMARRNSSPKKPMNGESLVGDDSSEVER